MSIPLININFQSYKEFKLRKNLKKYSPIRKSKTGLNSPKKQLPITKAETDIYHQFLSKHDTNIPGGNSPITPSTLPNSLIKSFSEYDLDDQGVCLNELAKINTRIGELDLRMNKNMRILESELKRNKELNEKFKIMEKELLVKKEELNISESPECTNNCRLW